THAIRWRVAHRTVGYGPLYQGRFKSFPVQRDEHLLSLLRYVERNPLSAGLVERAELWRWSSLWSRAHGDKAVKALLSPWPLERPSNWTVRVNSPLDREGIRPSAGEHCQRAVSRGQKLSQCRGQIEPPVSLPVGARVGCFCEVICEDRSKR